MRKINCSTVLPQNQDKVIHTWCTTFTLYSLFLHFKEEDRRIQTKLIMMARWTAASTSIQTYCWCFTFFIQSMRSVRFYLVQLFSHSDQHSCDDFSIYEDPHNTDVRYLVMLTVGAEPYIALL